MPGPFTHIYTARRIAEVLRSGGVTEQFIRPEDGELNRSQSLQDELLALTGRAACAKAMDNWPKFTAVGAVGPDLFFFLQDYNESSIDSDELMLAISLLYYLDDKGLFKDPVEGLLTILSEYTRGVSWSSVPHCLLL